MTNLTEKSKKTLLALTEKSKNYDSRMPSIKSIHELLNELGISHHFETSYNTVEHRSKGRRYVNSRHRGKEGYKIDIYDKRIGFEMDTSDSYYSANSYSYAQDLVGLINSINK